MRKSDEEKSMLYTLRVKCMLMEDDCIRAIEIPEDCSLYDLHKAIQEAVDFDNDHLFEFFMARTERSKRVYFTDPDDWEYVEEDWHQIDLYEIWPLKGLKLYYLFDFGDNWLFEIRKERKVKEPEPGVEYPRVIERIGDNPEQYPIWEEEEASSPTENRSFLDSGDDLKITYEFMDPSERPPLNEFAEIILEAMKEAGEPLSRKQLIKRTGILASEWSTAYALLMMHDIVETSYCKKRKDVFSYKGEDGETPEVLKEKPKKPSPPPSSLPFFGMEEEIDWGEGD